MSKRNDAHPLLLHAKARRLSAVRETDQPVRVIDPDAPTTTVEGKDTNDDAKAERVHDAD